MISAIVVAAVPAIVWSICSYIDYTIKYILAVTDCKLHAFYILAHCCLSSDKKTLFLSLLSIAPLTSLYILESDPWKSTGSPTIVTELVMGIKLV